MPHLAGKHHAPWLRYPIILAIAGAFLLLAFITVSLASKSSQSPGPAVMAAARYQSSRGLPQRASSLSPIHLPILMYHYVEVVQNRRDTMRIRLAVTPDILERQLQTLVDGGYSFYFVRDVPALMSGLDKELSKKVVLTFDDGYRDFYTNAFPLLKKYHVKCTIYLINHKLNGGDYLTDSQVKTLIASDLVEVGAHTLDHDDLAAMGSDAATKQIVGSKADLERRFGIKVWTFAYPSGEYDRETVKIVKDAGFAAAVTTHPGTEESPDTILTLTRIRPGQMTGRQLLAALGRKSFFHKAAETLARKLRALLISSP